MTLGLLIAASCGYPDGEKQGIRRGPSHMGRCCVKGIHGTYETAGGSRSNLPRAGTQRLRLSPVPPPRPGRMEDSFVFDMFLSFLDVVVTRTTR